jgi:hypothetical protein
MSRRLTPRKAVFLDALAAIATAREIDKAKGQTIGKLYIDQQTDSDADTDEAGHAFQYEAGHLYRSEAGHRSDLMSATGGLLPRIEVDDVSGDRIGQARIDFKSTNVAFAGFRR